MYSVGDGIMYMYMYIGHALYTYFDNVHHTQLACGLIINPQCACVARVTVLGLCVSVCQSSILRNYASNSDMDSKIKRCFLYKCFVT